MNATATKTRCDELLDLDRAGGTWQGTGLGNAISITHTIGTDGEGKYASFVVLTLEDDHGNKVSVAFDPTWGGVGAAILGSLKYHCDEAAKIRAERNKRPVV